VFLASNKGEDDMDEKKKARSNRARAAWAVRKGYDAYQDIDGNWRFARSIPAGEKARLPLEAAEALRRTKA
jgi:hypothetical protein